jgi:hypothetical protein
MRQLSERRIPHICVCVYSAAEPVVSWYCAHAHMYIPNGLLSLSYPNLVDTVKELHEWHVAKLTAHPCFERVPDEEMVRDSHTP